MIMISMLEMILSDNGEDSYFDVDDAKVVSSALVGANGGVTDSH